MSEERIKQLLAQIQVIEDVVEGEDHPSIPKPFVYRCTVSAPIPWSKEKIETSLQVTLPDELIHFWNHAAGLRLYEDVSYGQWGLTIWSPEEVLTEHPRRITQRREEDILKGDLIIGELIGDLDLPILRCDPRLDDFGKLLIALPIVPRGDWPVVAPSLTEFLERTAISVEYKYWSRSRKTQENNKP
jgi:SMI1 / KNR4 family (SUKH-1)